MKVCIPRLGAVALAFALSCSALLSAARAAAPAQKLNVVLILADDFGWTDLHCYGSEYYESPHIDQLAREGEQTVQAE